VATVLVGALAAAKPELALEESRNDLESLVGKRATQRLVRLAKRQVASRRSTRIWTSARKPKIAILTGKATATLARQLFDRLMAAGAHVWFYERSIKLGRRIRVADETALEGADYIVLLVSREALASNFVGYELDIVHWLEMKERRERLLPVIADDLSFEELPAMIGPLEAISAVAVGVSGVVEAISERLSEDRWKGSS
jgi:TIR domain-containing protein